MMMFADFTHQEERTKRLWGHLMLGYGGSMEFGVRKEVNS